MFEVNAVTMLKEELSWLEEVRVPTLACPAFQTLLGGHLQLCRILFTCEGVNKVELGRDERGGVGLYDTPLLLQVMIWRAILFPGICFRHLR